MPTQAPPAPDLDTVYDVEGGIEPFILDALFRAGVVELDPERGSRFVGTPRVEVQVHLGACIMRTHVPSGATQAREAWPTAWNCTLVFSVVTDRTVAAQNGAHARYRAKVRRLMAGEYFTVLNPRLPHHRLEKVTEMGTTPGMENAEARTEDVSRLQFAGVVSVRDTAWPAGT